MDVDHDPPHTAAEAQTLQSLTAGPLSSSVAKLAASSRCIPSERDFHFYRNFDDFKVPLEEIARESHSMLEAIGAAAQVAFPADDDAAYDWLVSVNDDVLERFDVSTDEFRRVRKEEEAAARSGSVVEDGFELVSRRKKKEEKVKADSEMSPAVADSVKVAVKDKKTTGPKPKVPFHIPTIRRPQDEYNILVNNTNMPFEHVWLQRSEDGDRFIHPLVSSLDCLC